MKVDYRACDRCGAKVGENVASGYGVALMVEYHHLTGTPLENMSRGSHAGAGYPSKERLLQLFPPPRCDNYQNEAFCQLPKGHAGDHEYDPRDINLL